MNELTTKQMTSQQVIDSAVKHGYKFKRFKTSWVGSYIPEDSIWNYKDVRHFEHCHPKVAIGSIYTGSVEVLTRYFSFMGINFPLVHVMLDESPNKVSFIFGFFSFYFVTIHTEELLDNSEHVACRSDTDWYIGCRSTTLLYLFLPFFRYMFRKAFDDFKDEDVPLQERREWLRARGYKFSRDTEEYTFSDTLDLTQKNISLGPNIRSPDILRISLSNLPEGRMTKIGDTDLFGFQVFRDKEALSIFPRLCPHEGGCLDLDSGVGGYLKECDFAGKVGCNFHVRYFDPIVVLPLREGQTAITPFYRFEIPTNELVIKYNPITDDLINQDWTKGIN